MSGFFIDMKRIAAISVLVIAIGCKKNEEKLVLPAPVAQAPVAKCFVWTSGRDTIRLSYVPSDLNVTGQLAYLFYEKDQSSGTISGTFVGDTLFVDYKFKSEGMTSIRETAFLKRGDSLIPGIGAVAFKDNREQIVNPHTLTFDPKGALLKTSCPD